MTKIVWQIDGVADTGRDEISAMRSITIRPAMGRAIVRVLVAEHADPDDVRRVLQTILVDNDVFLEHFQAARAAAAAGQPR